MNQAIAIASATSAAIRAANARRTPAGSGEVVAAHGHDILRKKHRNSIGSGRADRPHQGVQAVGTGLALGNRMHDQRRMRRGRRRQERADEDRAEQDERHPFLPEDVAELP
ncbi:hypothetical protein [Rhodococcus wratislaviensis]|jgi:hypothetical protein|uniref:hypothetical protein n=1 Tax=Rhodococcus wratislaviensis TaxID=44752 RepID=UPI001788D567|nr:hypothetical protein [Rhodococcus wratislaviensis]